MKRLLFVMAAVVLVTACSAQTPEPTPTFAPVPPYFVWVENLDGYAGHDMAEFVWYSPDGGREAYLEAYAQAVAGLEIRDGDFIPTRFDIPALSPTVFAGYYDGWFVYTRYQIGAGSGEFFWDDRVVGDGYAFTCRLFAVNPEIYRINPDLGFRTFDDLRSGYAQVHNGRIYFLDLVFEYSHSLAVGVGYLSHMAIDGGDIQRLAEEQVLGEFYIVDGTIYFLQADNLTLYTINTDGTNRQKLIDVGALIPVPWGMYLFLLGNFILIGCQTGDMVVTEADGSNPKAAVCDEAGFLVPLGYSGSAVFFGAYDFAGNAAGYWVYRAI